MPSTQAIDRAGPAGGVADRGKGGSVAGVALMDKALGNCTFATQLRWAPGIALGTRPASPCTSG
ncbi:hypothetical protein ACGTNG_17030 [Halomonas sp. 1390]|uniref:hypothetical protein n=1 Tax=Halomonas sp. B23F22_3 TaxID=3459516 RepID=UPI00373F11FB